MMISTNRKTRGLENGYGANDWVCTLGSKRRGRSSPRRTTPGSWHSPRNWVMRTRAPQPTRRNWRTSGSRRVGYVYSLKYDANRSQKFPSLRNSSILLSHIRHFFFWEREVNRHAGQRQNKKTKSSCKISMGKKKGILWVVFGLCVGGYICSLSTRRFPFFFFLFFLFGFYGAW